VQFPQNVIDIMAKFSWLNLHILAPFETNIGPDYATRKTLSSPQYASARNTTPGSLFVSNMFAFCMMLCGCLVIYFFTIGVATYYIKFNETRGRAARRCCSFLELLLSKKYSIFYLALQFAYLGICCSASLHLRGYQLFAGPGVPDLVYSLAMLIMVFYCLGLPAFVFLFIFFKKRQKGWFEDTLNARAYGFLWLEFKDGAEYFGAFPLLQKLLFGLCIGFVSPAPMAQVILLLFLNATYLVVLHVWDPYRSKLRSVCEYSSAFLFTMLIGYCFLLIYDPSVSGTPIFTISLMIAFTQLLTLVLQLWFFIWPILGPYCTCSRWRGKGKEDATLSELKSAELVLYSPNSNPNSPRIGNRQADNNNQVVLQMPNRAPSRYRRFIVTLLFREILRL